MTPPLLSLISQISHESLICWVLSSQIKTWIISINPVRPFPLCLRKYFVLSYIKGITFVIMSLNPPPLTWFCYMCLPFIVLCSKFPYLYTKSYVRMCVHFMFFVPREWGICMSPRDRGFSYTGGGGIFQIQVGGWAFLHRGGANISKQGCTYIFAPGRQTFNGVHGRGDDDVGSSLEMLWLVKYFVTNCEIMCPVGLTMTGIIIYSLTCIGLVTM